MTAREDGSGGRSIGSATNPPELVQDRLSAAPQDASDNTSSSTAIARPPAASICATNVESRSARLAPAATAVPSAASARAVASPIPEEAR
jgi:hypothetical protein